MRNLIKILPLFLAFVFGSCSKEDNSLIGHWVFESADYDVQTSDAETTSTLKIIVSAYISNMDFTFNADGTFSMNAKIGTGYSGTYTDENGVVTTYFVEDGVDKVQSIPYTIKKGKLQIELDEDPERFSGILSNDATIYKTAAHVVLKRK